jgi:hypothetical protein
MLKGLFVLPLIASGRAFAPPTSLWGFFGIIVILVLFQGALAFFARASMHRLTLVTLGGFAFFLTISCYAIFGPIVGVLVFVMAFLLLTQIWNRSALAPRTREPVAPSTNVLPQSDIPSVPRQGQQMVEPALASSLWKRALIGAFFLLEGILVLRFFLKSIGANPGNLFAGSLYALTDLVLFPFFGMVPSTILQPSHLVPGATYPVFEWPTLFAMLIFGLVFWVLPRFIFRSTSK